MARVLLVDDEPAVLFAVKEVVKSRGHDPVLARSGKEALERIEGVDAVVTDFAMPEMDGLALLSAIRERDESLPVVLLTAHGSERVAVRAMKAGAYEYVTKPFDIDELSLVIDRALETRGLRLQNRRLAAEKAIGKSFVGETPAMRRLLDAIGRVAPKDVTVLVRGETGTGKELVASLLHAQSRRAGAPLVRFNCAAIPGELAEAELFGHTRGAFTGAQQARRGFFAEADGGTLVLDEVGELPMPVQAKLLRALQEGEIQPVGAGRVDKVNVRVVACTNRDLEAEARAGRFREDLYWRLAVVELVVPPLREHRDDVPALAQEFARRYAQRFGLDEVRLSPELVERLRQAEWPGNVRQLENAIARMVALAPTREIGPDAFPAPPPRPAEDADEPEGAGPTEGATLREQLDALERSIIAKTMAETGGNQSEAARRLGVGRTAFIDRLKKYGLA
ncbi:MAG TPA: sigma-54 dependent transcriptional regulator [Anaeromyxobacteraceae bacterium]|nr:sigma-54 dependent transcriptional regulator [Anaeromyxobacteraceae bacterium]